MNLWFHEEMNLMYTCMPELLKEDFSQGMLVTSNIYNRYVCECYVWYFIHHGMIKCWLKSYIYVVKFCGINVINILLLDALVILFISKWFRVHEKVMKMYMLCSCNVITYVVKQIEIIKDTLSLSLSIYIYILTSKGLETTICFKNKQEITCIVY